MLKKELEKEAAELGNPDGAEASKGAVGDGGKESHMDCCGEDHGDGGGTGATMCSCCCAVHCLRSINSFV